MQILGLLSFAICGSLCLTLRSDVSNHRQFELFKADFSKSYKSPEEEELRKSIFGQNLQHIRKHNEDAASGLHSYTLGVNQFADMTSEEFVALRSTKPIKSQ